MFLEQLLLAFDGGGGGEVEGGSVISMIVVECGQDGPVFYQFQVRVWLLRAGVYLPLLILFVYPVLIKLKDLVTYLMAYLSGKVLPRLSGKAFQHRGSRDKLPLKTD